MFCQQCGATVPEGSKFCESCGAKITSNPDLSNTTAQYTNQPPSGNQKNPLLAAAASFLWTGMGQVYNGNLLRGFAFLIGALIGSMLLVIPGIIIWLFGVYDAYRTANQMNNGEIPWADINLTQVLIFVAGTIGIVILVFMILG